MYRSSQNTYSFFENKMHFNFYFYWTDFLIEQFSFSVNFPSWLARVFFLFLFPHAWLAGSDLFKAD